jgi:hypothetical protein
VPLFSHPPAPPTMRPGPVVGDVRSCPGGKR